MAAEILGYSSIVFVWVRCMRGTEQLFCLVSVQANTQSLLSPACCCLPNHFTCVLHGRI